MQALSILGVVAAFALVVLSAVCLCAEHGFLPLRRLNNGFRRLPLMARIFLVCFVVVLFVHGGTQNGGSTNAPSARLAVPQVRVAEPPSVALTPDQIVAGFALARIGMNETWDFSAPDGAHIHAPWRLRGQLPGRAVRRRGFRLPLRPFPRGALKLKNSSLELEE